MMMANIVLVILVIGIILWLIYKSTLLGGLSIIVGIISIVASFGFWTAFDGSIGFSIVAVTAIAIIVGDTVHFIHKFKPAIQLNDTSANSVIYTFNKVDVSLMRKTLILSIVFFLLTLLTLELDINMDIFTVFCSILFIIFVFGFGLRCILVGEPKDINKSLSNLSQWDGNIFYHCLFFILLQFLLLFCLFK